MAVSHGHRLNCSGHQMLELLLKLILDWGKREANFEIEAYWLNADKHRQKLLTITVTVRFAMSLHALSQFL